ncbi:RagB/SusD family nutrient uptake outer membrane protein [Dinghuibacter silviterrae]|uniref:Putative outer membrane starch-binding protein n=1 Tax=Dinghuibacter silviterrae TaxID=1539049 RepID=A0A4R8DPD6_9BACT|nr:RagB/SusD family nutrient uptake outer membrane protein [Dinghuibacter silviterrae]TDW99943.1 putative outer membrane starch-binding protein [Dinghuibacter silviterrae]
MKIKFIYIYGALGLGVLAAGCSKSFLNVPVQGQQPAVQLWQTATDAGNAVNAIYANLRGWNNTAFAAIAVESLGSDDAIKGSVPTDATFMNEYDQFTITATEGQLDGFWTGQYQNINLCNQVLDNVPGINMDGSLKARYLAEAKFVRAYSYFRLERAFGYIPLVLTVPKTAAQINPPQNTPAQVWAAIEQDLTDAASVLPQSYGATDIGRATKGAALSLHAKVALYQKKWSDVVNYTKQVMNLGYALFPNYEQMFRIANDNCSESVFEIQCSYVQGNSGINSSQYSQVQGDRDVSPSVGWGFNEPTQNLVNEFETGDNRLMGTVLMAGTTTPEGDVVPLPSAGAPSMYNMKSYVPFARAAAHDAAGNPGCEQHVRVLRYADVLLMNAEANNEMGDATDALSSLEMVRARARAFSQNPAVDIPAVTTTDQTQLRTAIYHERRVELAMENDRYFDVIRQGRAATVFGPLGWTSINQYWPIPQNEIDVSAGVLKQNNGY